MERKVISKKNMSSKLLDNYILWGLVFVIPLTIISNGITKLLNGAISGDTFYIVSEIVTVVLFAIYWLLLSNVATKETFKKFTTNKSEKNNLLYKVAIFFILFRVLYILFNILYMKIYASIGISMLIVDIIAEVICIGIIIYGLHRQKDFVNNSCVEGQEEIKLKVSVAAKILIGIIILIILVTVYYIINMQISNGISLLDIF